MSNWCNNYLTFHGEAKRLKEVQALFRSMEKKEQQTGHGQLPKFASEENGGHFFYIQPEEENIRYETKWSPNICVLKEIADRFDVGFEMEYDEVSNLLYGRATYHNGTLEHIFLEQADFDKYEYNEQTDKFIIEGQEYEIEHDIFDTLLQRKIQAHEYK